jgi:hypothetical protein
MQVRLTPAAAQYLRSAGAESLSVSALVISCCAGPSLPPEVRPGAPADLDGFSVREADGVTVYIDTLLGARRELVIDLKQFARLQELYVSEWE